MAVTRTESNVKWGFADIYLGDADAAEPASAATLAVPTGGTWAGVGFTAEGLMMDVSTDAEEIKVEEQLTPIGRVLTSANVTITFEFAEDIIENRLSAYGFGDLVTTAAGASQIGKKVLTLNEELTERAICIIAENSLGFYDRIYIPRVSAGGSVGTPYKRAEKRVYPVEFQAVCGMSEIKILQQTAAATV